MYNFHRVRYYRDSKLKTYNKNQLKGMFEMKKLGMFVILLIGIFTVLLSAGCSKEPAQEVTQGATRETTLGTTQAASQENTHGTTQAATKEITQATTQEEAQQTTQGTTQGEAQETVQETVQVTVQEITQGATQKDTARPYIVISMNISKLIKYPPSFAIWCEDSETKIKSTLFVTEKASKMNSPAGELNRPYNLPVWFSVKEDDVDVVSMATPALGTKEFQLQIPESLKGKKLNVYIEANVSFDYNEYYRENSTAADAFYNECSGQPSVIYKAVLDNLDGQSVKAGIIGFGNAAGKNGEIHNDPNVTTCRDIMTDITVTYYKG